MSDESLISGLINENEEAISTFGECENCVVTDWRDGAEEILSAVSAFLPGGYWQTTCEEENRWKIEAGGRPATIVQFTPKKQEPFFVQINTALRPDFEMWVFRPSMDDGYSLFLKPKSWWDAFRSDHNAVAKKYFISVDRLAEFYGKSYLARLFMKL